MIVAQAPSFTSLSTTPRNSIPHALPSPSILFSSNFSPRFHSARRNSRFFSSLRTLELSCRIFCSHRPLLSMACALFDKNTGAGGYSFRKLRLDHHICFRFGSPLFSKTYKSLSPQPLYIHIYTKPPGCRAFNLAGHEPHATTHEAPHSA